MTNIDTTLAQHSNETLKAAAFAASTAAFEAVAVAVGRSDGETWLASQDDDAAAQTLWNTALDLVMVEDRAYVLDPASGVEAQNFVPGLLESQVEGIVATAVAQATATTTSPVQAGARAALLAFATAIFRRTGLTEHDAWLAAQTEPQARDAEQALARLRGLVS